MFVKFKSVCSSITPLCLSVTQSVGSSITPLCLSVTQSVGSSITLLFSRMMFFSYLTVFLKKIQKVAEHGQNISKMDILKGVDGFQLFFIDFQL